ncbi:IclR family transcriptional regulator [Glaciimonas immobilis]|uniref:DNA-binding IclR family transcriptional regulator n=1 Tax=Glaciimonas immobilis TaxID=728004 RepID=A0A840RKK3_9BURK|nr:IclR family transcriptional regulator [Glaciimonas immobilis]KAF3998909.1 IclR family transcriptional regulator [Glaciimonas immobilis]MBB5198313.1 DNA-binding IclR family transcriptional regulator [Glaciimonas immobilis]
MNSHPAEKPEHEKIDGDTPTMRLFALLEVIAEKDQPFSLQGMVEETGLPKPTVHRMLQQLEGVGVLQRESDGRHYSTGVRLRKLASNLLINNTYHGARHTVLRQLMEEVGESCNLTAFTGSEVVYLDRMETVAPLRFYLQPGSRVPAHCSSTGKLFLAQMTPMQRRRLLAHMPMTKYTSNTQTDPVKLEQELEVVRRNGYAIDNEEFLPGLLCVAVLVPAAEGRSNLAVAIQAPIMRLTHEKALHFLPALQRAAKALAAIESETAPPLNVAT